MRHHQHLILKNCINGVHQSRSRFIHPQWQRVKGKNKIKIWDASLDRQPKIQSSSVEETLQIIMVQTNNDCRFRIFISTNSPPPATFACWKMRLKTEVCTCSQFPTEAMHWIKDVEMVDSVDDLRSSSSVRGIRMPDFEVLDARIASALNKIIHNSHLKKGQSGGTKSPKRGPFLSRKTGCLLDLRQWFRRELCRPLYYCSSKWWYSGIRFEMGWNFIINVENPTWWHLGRIVHGEKKYRARYTK